MYENDFSGAQGVVKLLSNMPVRYICISFNCCECKTRMLVSKESVRTSVYKNSFEQKPDVHLIPGVLLFLCGECFAAQTFEVPSVLNACT